MIINTFGAARMAALGACALACATAMPSRHAVAERDGPAGTVTIVAFGSSSTQGVGASRPSAAYPAQLQADLSRVMPTGWSAAVVNRGIGGQDIDDMVLRLQSDVIERHPDLVIWQIGSNDPLRHVPIDRFERDARAGIAAMQHAGITVVLMEQQWCPRLEATRRADAYRDVVRRVGVEMNVAVIRRSDLMHRWVRDGLITPERMLSADGLHMRDDGYALLARDAIPTVLAALAHRPRPASTDVLMASAEESLMPWGD